MPKFPIEDHHLAKINNVGTTQKSITDDIRAFIEHQKVFFVATAACDGHVNVSPKGHDCLRVLAPDRVLWINGGGGSNATADNVLDLPRMTLMFCSFEKEPLVVRVYGTVQTYFRGDPEWDSFYMHFPSFSQPRNIFDVHVESVHSACGTSVPIYEYQSER